MKLLRGSQPVRIKEVLSSVSDVSELGLVLGASSFKKIIIITYNFIITLNYVYVCGFMHMSAGVHRGQRGGIPWRVVSHLMCMLGIEFSVSGRE